MVALKIPKQSSMHKRLGGGVCAHAPNAPWDTPFWAAARAIW